MVSLPVLNPHTILNHGFDTYRLMPQHNDMRAMVPAMTFSEDQPSFYLLNVGETHYPYALPDEPPEQWPRISGVHGVFKHLDDHVVGGKLQARARQMFNQAKLDAAARPPGRRGPLPRPRRGRAVRHRPQEHLHHHHCPTTASFRRRRLFRTRAHPAREGLRSLPGRRQDPMIYPIAYIGPGAGFAFLGSFLTHPRRIPAERLLAPVWPFRVLWRLAASRLRRSGKRQSQQADLPGARRPRPGLTERFMAEGKLPNSRRLASRAAFRRLRTTFPALSPVAWSTFATGVNPARHNIFDFLNRDLKSLPAGALLARASRGPRRF